MTNQEVNGLQEQEPASGVSQPALSNRPSRETRPSAEVLATQRSEKKSRNEF